MRARTITDRDSHPVLQREDTLDGETQNRPRCLTHPSTMLRGITAESSPSSHLPSCDQDGIVNFSPHDQAPNLERRTRPEHHPAAGLPLAGIVLVFAYGVSGYMIFGFPFVDALYLSTLALTTAGFTPAGELDAAAKAFTVTMAIFGVRSF